MALVLRHRPSRSKESSATAERDLTSERKALNSSESNRYRRGILERLREYGRDDAAFKAALSEASPDLSRVAKAECASDSLSDEQLDTLLVFLHSLAGRSTLYGPCPQDSITSDTSQHVSSPQGSLSKRLCVQGGMSVSSPPSSSVVIMNRYGEFAQLVSKVQQVLLFLGLDNEVLTLKSLTNSNTIEGVPTGSSIANSELAVQVKAKKRGPPRRPSRPEEEFSVARRLILDALSADPSLAYWDVTELRSKIGGRNEVFGYVYWQLIQEKVIFGKKVRRRRRDKPPKTDGLA